MSVAQPFCPQSYSWVLSSNAVANTNQSTPIYYGTALGIPVDGVGFPTLQPQQLRILNKGTVDVWHLLTNGPAGGTAAIPTTGTTTFGTPQPGFWAAPGVEISLTLPIQIKVIGSLLNGINQYGFWINTIATVASQVVEYCLGEGT